MELTQTEVKLLVQYVLSVIVNCVAHIIHAKNVNNHTNFIKRQKFVACAKKIALIAQILRHVTFAPKDTALQIKLLCVKNVKKTALNVPKITKSAKNVPTQRNMVCININVFPASVV